MSQESYPFYQENENIFRTLIEESPTPVGLYVGREMVIQLANRSILNVWGKDESIIGKTFSQALPELEGQPFFQLLDDVYTSGIAYEATEDRVDLLVNGQMQIFYFNFIYKPLKNNAGEVWGIINTATDVTELVLTRQQLARAEERVRFALESAELGTWDLNPISEEVVWDDRCQELFGFNIGENVLYSDVLSCIHPNDVAYVTNEVAKAVDTAVQKPYDIKYRTVGANDKKTRWVRAKGRAYFNEQGVCNRFAGTVQDITREVGDNEEQQKLLKLIDNSSDFISLSDIEGNVNYVNTAGRRMLGIKPAGIYRHNSEYVTPAELTKLKNKVNKTLQEEGRWSGEINYRHFETGEAIPVFGTTMLVYDSTTGEPQGRATLARDLRREIAAKKALTESEHLLKNITDASPTSLWMADENGALTYVNQTWLDWTGQTFEQALGAGWLNAVLPEDGLRASERFISDFNLRSHYAVDFRIMRKDGEIRNCVASGNPQYRQNGDFAGYIGACIDVTEKIVSEQEIKRKNEELNDQIKQFEFVTGFMPVQLWTAKTNGELDYVNQRTVDFFGVPAEEIIGPAWQTFVHPDDFAACIDVWVHSLTTGNPYQFEFRLKDKQGDYKWHLARALPFYSEGEIIKWFGTNTDIDQQKQLQRQKDDFLGIASHELKTPVTSIKAYAQVLGAMLTKEGETKKANMVVRMDAQVNRLTNLIGDLLDVTKINSGRLQFNKTWFDFNQAIKETVEDLQHTTHKHTLIQNFTPTGSVYADKDRISQVITNLITNAIKYSPASDKIIISTKLKNNEVSVCVQDYGIGIPSDKKDRVFEQFYRVSGTKQHTFPGLGLGLYISSEIIKREGGRMWVTSIEGKGSTFCFALPADDSPGKTE